MTAYIFYLLPITVSNVITARGRASHLPTGRLVDQFPGYHNHVIEQDT